MNTTHPYSTYEKALRRIQKKARKHHPYGLRFCLGKPISCSRRLPMADGGVEEGLMKIFVFGIVWYGLVFIIESLIETVMSPLPPKMIPTLTGFQLFKELALEIFPVLVLPSLIVVLCNYFYELHKKRRTLTLDEVALIHQALTDHPELVEIIAPWMKKSTLRYGEFAKIMNFGERLDYALKLDRQKEEEKQEKMDADAYLREGPLGVFLDKQALQDNLPNSQCSSNSKRI